MGFVKCPRCELNYMREGELYCEVCKKELKSRGRDESGELCIECGENPALPGKELCAICLREHRAAEDDDFEEQDDSVEESSFETLGMEENDDIPVRELKVIHGEFGDDDDDDDDDDEEDSMMHEIDPDEEPDDED